jgi:hypothetical protein
MHQRAAVPKSASRGSEATKKSTPFAESRPRDPEIADLPELSGRRQLTSGTIDLGTLRLMLIEHKFLE